MPNDRIMIETDAPWCGVKPSHPGHSSIQTKWPAKDKKKRSEIDTGETVKDRSEPCHIAQVLEVLAAVKGEDADDAGGDLQAEHAQTVLPGGTRRSLVDSLLRLNTRLK